MRSLHFSQAGWLTTFYNNRNWAASLCLHTEQKPSTHRRENLEEALSPSLTEWAPSVSALFSGTLFLVFPCLKKKKSRVKSGCITCPVSTFRISFNQYFMKESPLISTSNIPIRTPSLRRKDGSFSPFFFTKSQRGQTILSVPHRNTSQGGLVEQVSYVTGGTLDEF